jgi:DNA polymerase-3 subunit delta
MDALTFLDLKKAPEAQPVYVLTGAQRFLKRLVLGRLQALTLGSADSQLARSVFNGENVTLAQVRDDLETLPFISPRRLVIVEEADAFITRYRDKLEKYVSQPSRTGVLVLDVESWRSNTRLAKLIPDAATIVCDKIAPQQLRPWVVKRSAATYGKELEGAAAAMLVEDIGPELGVLDQELAKLAAYAGDQKKITAAMVDTLVGHSRMETAWQMLDALAVGNGRAALATLHHLFEQGEEPVAVLGAVSWQLRRIAQVARLVEQGESLVTAMGRAGLPPFKRDQVGQFLQRLGKKVGQVYEWLLDADRGLKSSDQLPPRATLERLVIRLAGPAVAVK